MAFKTEKTIQDLLYSAMRKVNGYSDGDVPDANKVQEALEAFTDIIDHLDNEGVRLFQREWRQRVFTTSSAVVGSDGEYYRCIKSYTSPNYAAWADANAYAVGDLVIPATYNGFYYICTVAGTSAAAEPTFPIVQDITVSDGTVTWRCIPDLRPVDGKNYKTNWYKDDSLSAGDVYAANTSYYNQGEFDLKDDEIYILNAFIRYTDFDERIIELIPANHWQDIGLKWIKGIPETAYLDYTAKDSVTVRLDPIPQLTGASGYIMHYEVLKRADIPDSASDDSPYADNWNRVLTWMLVSEIQSEYSVPDFTKIYNDKKAAKLYKEAMKRDKPKLTSRRVTSCFSPESGSRYGERRSRYRSR